MLICGACERISVAALMIMERETNRESGKALKLPQVSMGPNHLRKRRDSIKLWIFWYTHLVRSNKIWVKALYQDIV